MSYKSRSGYSFVLKSSSSLGLVIKLYLPVCYVLHTDSLNIPYDKKLNLAVSGCFDVLSIIRNIDGYWHHPETIVCFRYQVASTFMMVVCFDCSDVVISRTCLKVVSS